MRILFVADFRSPIARGWIQQVAGTGQDVMVVSTYPFTSEQGPEIPAKVVDITLARLWNHRVASGNHLGHDGAVSRSAALLNRIRNAPASRRWALSIKELAFHSFLPGNLRDIRAIMRKFQPDLVHALRIPFEGIVAARAIADDKTPFVVSIWGNDLTLIAAERAALGRDTRSVLQRADALITDCDRDLRLAKEWGFSHGRPTAVVPTSGGIDVSTFFPGPASQSLVTRLHLPTGSQVIVNPRGFREYVCQEAFFRAVPAVIERIPNLVVIAIGLQGFPSIRRLVERLGIAQHVRLLPALPHRAVGDVFRLASVSVSPSLHDGTPNSLLEAMATGCLPVAGDIESIREWINDGYNGLLCDPRNPASQADAIIHALSDEGLRAQARAHNFHLVRTRAERSAVMSVAGDLYREISSR
jgi:glycosyltransferase involved in cell wall biosynthesis